MHRTGGTGASPSALRAFVAGVSAASAFWPLSEAFPALTKAAFDGGQNAESAMMLCCMWFSPLRSVQMEEVSVPSTSTMRPLVRYSAKWWFAYLCCSRPLRCQLTNEARAEPKLVWLCIARRKKTEGQRPSRTQDSWEHLQMFEYRVTDESFRYADYKDVNDYLIRKRQPIHE